MRVTAFAAMLASLLWGTPAFAQVAPDSDGDGVGDAIDNCSDHVNPAQDDTDADDCGNLCDADYDNNGIVGFPDFSEIIKNYACPGRPVPPNDPCPCIGIACEEYMHVAPIGGPGRNVGFPDFAFLVANYASVPGPSGTTAGTIACP